MNALNGAIIRRIIFIIFSYKLQYKPNYNMFETCFKNTIENTKAKKKKILKFIFKRWKVL